MTSHELDSFQTSLLSDLREHVATRGAAHPGVTALDEAPSARRRRGRTLVWGVGLAAACTAAAIAIPTMSAQPAYAVTSEPDGVVHVRINRLEDASTLQADLKREGIDADVRYLPAGTECAPNRFTPMPSDPHSQTEFAVGSIGMDVTIDRRDLRAGATVVIAASHTKHGDGTQAEVGIAKGPVARCTIIPSADEETPE